MEILWDSPTEQDCPVSPSSSSRAAPGSLSREVPLDTIYFPMRFDSR